MKVKHWTDKSAVKLNRALKVTIAIATWNRYSLLKQTLDALGRVRVPADVTAEVLVCDNNSSDQTRAVVESFISLWANRTPPDTPLTLRYLFEPQPGKTFALNRILREAAGQWILNTDDDVLVGENWLESYLEGIRRHPHAGVLAGPVLPWLVKPVNPRQKKLMQQYPGPFALISVDHEAPLDPQNIVAAGANLALLRAAIPSAGYNPRLGPRSGQPGIGDDTEMVRVILTQGYEGWILPGPIVQHYVHPHRLNCRYLWRWQTAIGRRWIETRGKPQPGKLGVPWWAWREMFRRWTRTALTWRPRYTHTHLQAVVEAAHWWGYMRG